MEPTENRDAAKPRTRQGVKKEKPLSERTKKLTLLLTPKELRVVGAEAVGSGRSYSEIIGKLIIDNCKRYVLTDKFAKHADQVSASEATSVNNAGETLPMGEILTDPSPSEEETASGAGEGENRSPALKRRRAAG